MWIKKGLIVGLVITIQFIGTSSVNQTICAYQNETFRLNSTADIIHGDEKLMELLSRGTHGQFVKDHYEYCPGSTGNNHCFTLWGDAKNKDEPPVIIKQGCWMVTNNSNECQSRRCNYQSSESAVDSQVKFCCCTGNKCNDVNRGTRKQQSAVTSSKTDVLPTDTEKKNDKKGKKGGKMLCAFKSPDHVSGKLTTNNQGIGNVQKDGISARCNSESDLCFSYYQLDPQNTSKIAIKFQGCWNARDQTTKCDADVCVPNKYTYSSQKQSNYSHFCCCYGDMCNNNISKDVVIIVRNTTESNGPVYRQLRDPSYKERTIVISLLSVFSMAIIILAMYLVYRFCFQVPQSAANMNNNVELPQSPAFDIEDLKISCMITKGRYSEVWKGSLHEQEVAVKIYTPYYRQYYYNEKYIYSLPHMDHENIIKFLGGEEQILQDGSTRHLLVLEYVPDGTLMNYLKNNTIDWHTMCKMCQTLARGMSHLHSDIGTAECYKPTVAHRDINSRNVLVKADLSCVIADLGFCMTTRGSKLIHKSHTENAEQTSLTDVGTLRYMAPELLDGAVNLRDCEASLKQIDMYAFGLVMWEIASRCSDLYQGCPMPDFSLPYQAEAGNHPTFEEMQLMVSRNKIRPKFPEVWKEYNQAIRALKETIEECWDHDAEARLTALCVEERILEMKSLWSHDNRNKNNKGVTPTINTALLSHAPAGSRPGYHGNGHTQWGGLSSSTSDSTVPNVVAEGSTSALIINDIRNSTGAVMSQSESTSTLPPNWTGDRRGSFSTSTMETTVGTTPGEAPSHPKSQNINAMMNQQVPRNQGRNPIVERNTHKRSDEELAVVGNNLLYGKNCNEAEGLSNSDSMFDSFTDSLESSLMQNDRLNHGRSPPTTYLHNQRNLHTNVHTELPPKVINNPHERHDNFTNAGNILNSSSQKPPKKAREMGILGHLALIGKLAFGGKFDSKKNEVDNSSQSRMENGRVNEGGGRQNPIFEPTQTFETEVRLTNTGTVVRPANFQTKPSNIRNCETSLSNVERAVQRNSVDVDSIDSSEPDVQSDSPLISRHRVAPYSKSTSDLSPQKTSSRYSKIEEDESKMPRPSTLALKGHNYDQSSSGSLNSLSKLKGKMSQRGGKFGANKRPLQNGYTMIDNSKGVNDNSKATQGKSARHSLHDDRLMSECNKNVDDEDHDWKSSVSLQQFSSIDENVPKMTDCTC